jgi:hypothetical protein
MKFLWGDKDGGPESKVYVWGLEIKSLFSVLALKFELGSREAYHSHAFNAISWVLKGGLNEHMLDGPTNYYGASRTPVVTRRATFHKVMGLGNPSWVLTFRGPWANTWLEFLPKAKRFITLTHGRKEISQ